MIKEERRKKKRRKISLTVILGVLIVLAIAALIIMKVFRVRNVEVEGNKLYDSKMIEDTVLNDEYSWNSLYVFLKYRFTDPKSIPFVDTMEITLKNPHTLHITVYEKGIVGYIFIPSINENAYFDKDGFVVETSSDVIPDIPMIQGINCDQVVLYEQLPIDGDTLKELLSLTQTLKKYNLIPDSITYGVDNAPVLTYGSIQVMIGDTTQLTPKIERVSKIMPNLEGLSGVLHMENWTENTTNIVFDKTE